MTQLSVEKNYPVQKPLNWSRILLVIVSLLIVSGLIAGLAFYFSPPGRRYFANQTAMQPVVGATEIDVIGHDVLNHVFAPAVTEVEAGSTITWHFKEVDEGGSPVNHNVVFDDLASPVLASGTFSRTFEEPGTYEYTCTLHAYMDGVIVVTAVTE